MATQGVDFSKLNLKDALDLAMLIEEEARDRYQELAEQLEMHHTADAAGFFRKMIHIEELHRSALEKRRKEVFGQAPIEVSRAMLFDVEAPEYDGARAEMTVRQALRTALTGEVKAHAFFEQALARIKDPQARALFEELKGEEVEHQQWIRLELERCPATESNLNNADEPVAH